MTARNQHAVVIGAGFAGLYAAQVLSEHFERVTVVERDALDGRGGRRRPVPQAPHPHFLLTAYRALAQRFPALPSKLDAHGAVFVDCARDVVFRTPEGSGARAGSQLWIHMCSRQLLDALMFAQVAAVRRVRFKPGWRVDGIELRPDRRRVARLHLSQVSGSVAEAIEADLFVDASGRNGRSTTWIEAAGLVRPGEETFGHPETYHTARFGPATGHRPDYRSAVVLSPEVQTGMLGSLCVPVENGGLVASIVTLGQDSGIDSVARLRELLRQTPDQLVHAAIGDAQPLEDRIHRYHCPASRAVDIDALEALDNFLLLGDTLCSLTPLLSIGLGMAAWSAEALDLALRQAPAAPAGPYYARCRALVRHSRQLLENLDRRFLARPGAASPGLASRLYDLLATAFVRASTRDPAVHQAYLRLRFFEAPRGIAGGRYGPGLFGTSLLANPVMIARVLAALCGAGTPSRGSSGVS